MKINVIPSERFVVTVEVGGTKRKVLQVTFNKFESDDPAIFVQWPYYQLTDGLLSVMTLPPGRDSHTLSLKPTGKLTSHDVKYTHHHGGEAHFSQDGKIRTEVRKASVSLQDYNGHLFTCQFQGLSDFDEAVDQRDQHHHEGKRSVINFHFPGDEPTSVKILGYWKPIGSIRPGGGSDTLGPKAAFQTPDGKFHEGFILAPRNFEQSTHILLLTCEGIPKLDKDRYSCFTFIGGFDPPGISHDPTIPTDFLAASYPADDPQSLLREIGTVDLDATTTPAST